MRLRRCARSRPRVRAPRSRRTTWAGRTRTSNRRWRSSRTRSARCGELETSDDDEAEVEAHHVGWSDENLKQAVAKLEDALAALRELETKGEDAEVEAHHVGWSDKNLKQAVAQLEQALEQLRNVGTETKA